MELIERAETVATRHFKDLGVETVSNYVIFDEPYRTSYKTYTWSPESAEDSIWLIGDHIKPHPIEDNKESGIIQGLRQQKNFPRLIKPGEVKSELIK